MASLVVMYKTPTDPKAFDKHYSETHISIAKPRAHPQTSNTPAPYPASIGIRMV